MRGKMSIFIAIVAIVIVGVAFSIYQLSKQQNDITLEKGLNVSTFGVEDPKGQTSLTAKLWRLPESEETPKGVILVSHGFSANADSLQRYAANLAQAGYVVAAVSHQDLKGLRSGQLSNDPMVARQRHLKLLLENLYLNDANLKQLPVGILGYSLGGYAALTSTHFRALLDKQENYCASLSPGDNVLICNPRFSQRISALSAEPELTPTPSIPAKAIALFAPAYTELIDLDKSADAPAIFLANGIKDEFISVGQMDDLARQHSYVKEHQELMEAGHYAYLPTCSWPFNYFIESCRDPIPIDRAQFQNTLIKNVINFFDDNLAIK
ncbi:putative lipoprotein signal peptide [Grimontia indica]|uniref:Lipoprotein signal peptide n=2 Tax=Grimontia indica TaxID=1056512 RepID=R1GXF1_9GAMM|nr:putative lipoprotein signal peptide [Grimontia indica]